MKYRITSVFPWRVPSSPSVKSFPLCFDFTSLIQGDGDFLKIEDLCTFDGEKSFALGQGQ